MAFLPLARSGGSAFPGRMQANTLPADAPVVALAPAGRPTVLTDALLVASARNLAYSLPLGHAPLPLAERERRSGAAAWSAAIRRLEGALLAVAVRHEVCVDLDAAASAVDPLESLARRLCRSRAIAPAAADAVLALVPVLRRGASGGADAAVELSALRVTERLTGYVRSRAA